MSPLIGWKAREKECTILPTGRREHATNSLTMKKAIDELNSFVVGNSNLAKGISTSTGWPQVSLLARRGR